MAPSSVADAARARRRRAKQEAARIGAYKRTVADVERIAHGGRAPVATGQTIVKSRLSESPLARLIRRGALNVWEESAADEIVTAFQLSAGMDPNRADASARAEPRPGAADAAAATRIDAVDKYRQWRDDLRDSPALAAAVALLIDERPMREMERANRWRNGAARNHLITALRHFAALRGNTPRGAARDWRQRPAGDPLEKAVRLARLIPRAKGPLHSRVDSKT